MKKAIIATAVLTAWGIYASNLIWFNRTDGTSLGLTFEDTDSICIENNNIVVTTLTNGRYEIPREELTNAVPGTTDGAIEVIYNGKEATVKNPRGFQDVDVTVSGAHVEVHSTAADEVTYRLSGATTDGSFKIYSDKKIVLELAGVDITNTDGAAINIQTGKKTTLNLVDGTVSNLTDSKKYNSTPDGEDEKGTLFSEGQIIFTGAGQLNVTAKKKHAIVSDDYIEMEGGNVNVLSAASDGVHVNEYFQIKDGSLTTRSTSGDGIDADAGYIKIKGGKLDIEVATADTKGIKCDSIIAMSGGEVVLNLTGDQTKGFKTKQSMTLSGGSITATTSGNVVVTDGDPSYCAAIKTDGDFTMSGGSVNITAKGEAGKGISVDGDATFSGGDVTIATSGNGNTYMDANNQADSYSSTCITIDGDLNLLNGVFNLSSSGTAGKCIKVDGVANFGDETNSPTITATTTGAKFVESSSSASWGWNWGNNTDYANPKVIKSAGNMNIYNGTFTLKSTQDGGEGLESKDTLTINGGSIDISTVDDCINASNSVVINGGYVHCIASGNDAIDSNGTMTITGGVVVAVGASSPEGGLDCDQNTFTITGGTVIGAGGSNSTPTSSKCKQSTIVYNASLSNKGTLTITDSDGNHVLSFKNPTSNSSMAMIITSPDFVSGSSYKIYTGGTVTGGETFNELTTNGSYTPGTQATTFSATGGVTNVSGNGGNGGGGNGGGFGGGGGRP